MGSRKPWSQSFHPDIKVLFVSNVAAGESLGQMIFCEVVLIWTCVIRQWCNLPRTPHQKPASDFMRILLQCSSWLVSPISQGPWLAFPVIWYKTKFWFFTKRRYVMLGIDNLFKEFEHLLVLSKKPVQCKSGSYFDICSINLLENGNKKMPSLWNLTQSVQLSLLSEAELSPLYLFSAAKAGANMQNRNAGARDGKRLSFVEHFLCFSFALPPSAKGRGLSVFV